MRAHGIANFPDPGSNGHFNLTGINLNAPQVRRALETCGRSSSNDGSVGVPPEDMARALRFTRCMRADGVTNFADPNPDGQNSVHVSGPTTVYQRALAACRPLLSGKGSHDGSTP
jgi:hypothetical protein